MIQIGKIIFNTLKNKAGLVGEKIYPIVAPEATPLPFVVYERLSGDSVYSKDGLAYDEPVVTFYILSSTYEDAVNKAQIVRDTFELKEVTYSGMTINGGVLDGISEEWNGETYIQKIVMRMKVYK